VACKLGYVALFNTGMAIEVKTLRTDAVFTPIFDLKIGVLIIINTGTSYKIWDVGYHWLQIRRFRIRFYHQISIIHTGIEHPTWHSLELKRIARTKLPPGVVAKSQNSDRNRSDATHTKNVTFGPSHEAEKCVHFPSQHRCYILLAMNLGTVNHMGLIYTLVTLHRNV